MATVPTKIETWQMVEIGKLKRITISIPNLKPEEALVEIAGCGVCHTDLGYFYDGIPTVSKPPLTLGHEIAGTIVAGPSALIDKNVIIPAVLPCHSCDICASGRGNRCLAQKMPGNSLSIYGGFSSHIPVPVNDLCIIDELKMPLSHYAVLADAVTTPYQAAIRAGITTNDLIVIIGAAGGVGTYMTQIAKALGAAIVIAIDIHQPKLEQLLAFGADYIINSKEKAFKLLRAEFNDICKKNGVPSNIGWKIFECTGVTSGQELALGLLSFIGKLIVVGFTMKPINYILSRLMAFDAEIIGTWGCLPEHYPKVLSLVQNNVLQIEPFLEIKPMSQIKQVFEQHHLGFFNQRQILVPDF